MSSDDDEPDGGPAQPPPPTTWHGPATDPPASQHGPPPPPPPPQAPLGEPAWPPPPGPYGQPPYGPTGGAGFPPGAGARQMRWDAGSITLLLGTVVTALAAFLPWASARSTFIPGFQETVSGLDDGRDGTFTLILAIAAGLFGLIGVLNRRKGLLVTAIICGAAIAAIGLVNIIDISNKSGEARAEGVEFSIQIGLILTFLAGIPIIVGSVLSMKANDRGL